MGDCNNLKFESHSENFDFGKMDCEEYSTVSYPLRNSFCHLENHESKQLSELLKEGEKSEFIENFDAEFFLKELRQKYLNQFKPD